MITVTLTVLAVVGAVAQGVKFHRNLKQLRKDMGR